MWDKRASTVFTTLPMGKVILIRSDTAPAFVSNIIPPSAPSYSTKIATNTNVALGQYTLDSRGT